MSIESTRFLPALAPRVYEGNSSAERLGCLKNSANLFALGRSMTVSVVRDSRVIEQRTLKQQWLLRALKIAAMVTVILPLLAYLGAKLYAKINPLQIQEALKPAEASKKIELIKVSSLSPGVHPEVEGLEITDFKDFETRLGDFPELKSVSIDSLVEFLNRKMTRNNPPAQ